MCFLSSPVPGWLRLLQSGLLCVLLPASSIAQENTVMESVEHMKHKVGDHQLQYLLQVPTGDAPADGWPLLLFLHGYGECGTDPALLKVHGPAKRRNEFPQLQQCVIVAPQCPKNSWWRVAALKALVEEVVARQGNIDSRRLYISGLSMGGYGTWSLLSHYPDLFTAAVPICGGGDPLRLPANVVPNKIGVRNEFDPEGLKQAVQIPVWTLHGTDDGAVPIAETDRIVKLLREAGNEQVRYTVYEHVGHVEAWQRAYTNPETWEWLFRQVKP